MKLMQKKTQAILFANAISGMSGVRFPGISNASQFWHNPILEEMHDPQPKNADGIADENSVRNLLKLFGSSMN